MKKSDLSELKISDIDMKLEENQTKLQSLRFQKALQQLEDPLEIKSLKKEIAQLLTIKNEFIKGIRLDEDAS
ncbi:MAG: 50S ribosomal protein L29 [Candidatus Marinimicrobia bacterium]|jgi:large subunit ribosomal protein L29|nr:50S ribosomal protein L29 [Candidatus Neomarinimicrobiota bacterium]MEC9006827.1 50S ribosomal protein L29 [Candidatus Neomarinimicrobiota bacterium]|tara:strand:- start:548 stop:763 length:216 start_codon:yes stop_codon:yes gene_type:complete